MGPNNPQNANARLNDEWHNDGAPGETAGQTPAEQTEQPVESDFLSGGQRNEAAAETSSRNMGKVEDIQKAMSGITLPSTAVPDWANQLSDEEWRKALSERLNLSKK